MEALGAERTTDPKELKATLEEAMIQLELMGQIFGRKIQIRAGIQWLLFGILWTVMGAELAVRSILSLTADFQLDPWLIGITIVALGTTLPDIAASYHAARRGFGDLALGEGIGANIVSILLTLGLMGIIQPFTFDRSVVLPILVVLNLSTFMMIMFMVKGMKITQVKGIALISTYFALILATLFLLFF